MQSQNITPPCRAHQPLSHWRTCDECAKNRQAKIADIAEAIQNKYPSLAWITLTPSDGSERTINAIRDAYLRQANPPAGLWTIEQGGQSGKLHCNIITPQHIIPRTRGAEIHLQVTSGNIRQVAAYISKRSQIPALGAYSGRTFGRFGLIRDFLPNSEMPDIAQAAYVERHIIQQSTWERFRPASDRPSNPEKEKPQDYKANMRKNLPRLMEILNAGLHKTNQG